MLLNRGGLHQLQLHPLTLKGVMLANGSLTITELVISMGRLTASSCMGVVRSPQAGPP